MGNWYDEGKTGFDTNPDDKSDTQLIEQLTKERDALREALVRARAEIVAPIRTGYSMHRASERIDEALALSSNQG